MDPNPFPWPTPDPGDLRMRGGETDAVTSRAVVEWFIERWAPGFVIPTDAPLGAILEAVRRHECGVTEAPFRSTEEQRAWEHRILALRRLAWSIGALHGRAGRLADVHQSFIKRELCGIDSREGMWGMAMGIGTVCLAGRLLNASGGSMKIMGAGSAGHDIEWEPATGGSVIIERKDRAYERGVDEPLNRRVRHLVGRVREAGRAFPSAPGAARVLAVGFPGYVPVNKANRTRRRFEEALAEAVGPKPEPDENPDLIVEFVGSADTLTGGYEMSVFWDVIDFGFDRPEWLASRGAFKRAFTHESAPGPWPIRFL